jgi:hypothetical protein
MQLFRIVQDIVSSADLNDLNPNIIKHLGAVPIFNGKVPISFVSLLKFYKILPETIRLPSTE